MAYRKSKNESHHGQDGGGAEKRSLQRNPQNKGKYLPFIPFQGMAGIPTPCDLIRASLQDEKHEEDR